MYLVDEIFMTPSFKGKVQSQFIQAESHTTKETYVVPVLTDDQIVAAYNGIMAGNNVFIVDDLETIVIPVLDASSIEENVSVTAIFRDKLVLTYQVGTEVIATPICSDAAAFVTPEQYGAIGDGISDDTAAFQNALVAAAGRMLKCNGHYKITAPLTVYDYTTVTCDGASTVSGQMAYGTIDSYVGSVEDEDNLPLFIGENGEYIDSCTFSNLRFYNKSGVRDSNNLFVSVLFDHVKNTRILHTSSHNFACFTLGISNCTLIDGNRIIGFTKSLSDFCTDSFIVNNYINSSGTAANYGNIMLRSLNNSSFIGNFVDYWETVFRFQAGNAGAQITGNTFDDCRCVFRDYVCFATIMGNTFTNIKYQDDNWGTKPTNLINKIWSVFLFDKETTDSHGNISTGFSNTTFNGNIVRECSYYFYCEHPFQGSVKYCNFSGNQMISEGLRPLARFKSLNSLSSTQNGGLQTVYFDFLEDLLVDSLTNDSVIGSMTSLVNSYNGISIYKGMHVIYQGERYECYVDQATGACTWVKCTPRKTSDLQNDSGYLTGHQSLAAYRTATEQDAIARNDYHFAMPKFIYLRKGISARLYFSGLLNDNYNVKIGNYTNATTIRSYDDCVEIVPHTAGTKDMGVVVLDRHYNLIEEHLPNVAEKFLRIKISETPPSDQTMLCIGDSFISMNVIEPRLRALFAADGKTLTLLGTKGSGQDKHEGYAGKKYTDFANGFSGSPFGESGFSFLSYMTTQGYSGVDKVYIQLGTNDVSAATHNQDVSAALSAAQTIIDSILAYSASIKILLGLTVMPNDDSEVFAAAYNGTGVNWIMRDNMQRLNKGLIDLYRESPSVEIVPTNMVLDTTVDIADNVHPTNAGFHKMADQIYYTIMGM